jgi:asparaginyl-tRNA synthetase
MSIKRTKLSTLSSKNIGETHTICGWVRTVRSQKNFAFLEIVDGSMMKGLQVLAGPELDLCLGSSVSITGKIVESPGQNQAFEMHAEDIHLFGACSAADYPLQKKRHTFEFARTIAHLRPRTNTQGAVTRVRNALAFATHKFFNERGFLYIQTPIISSSDCEGAGEQFKVTTLNLAKPPKHSDGSIDMSKDFFERPTYLTVSGQLEAECFACALSDVYTFGPTFRAENSNTTRHLAEFWMIEPEIAFADLEDNMQLAEEFLKYVISNLFDTCPQELEFFETFIEKGLIERLKHVLNSSFAHLSYTEAVEILQKSGRSFEFTVEWGKDLQSEHERFLAEEYAKKPVILTDYPKRIKSFYMRDNADGKTVAAMDILVPKIGEIIGGSQREEREDVLKRKIEEMGLNPTDYWWYLQLRKFGTVPHAGFGAGFERLILFATGMENIRDVIPFPRYPGHAEF